MINLVDRQGRFQFVNRHWEDVTGWTQEEVRRHPDILAEFFPEPAYHREVVEYILHPPAGWAEFRVRIRDGRVLHTLWTNVLLEDGTSIGLGLDITERRRAEAERERLHQEVSASREQLKVLSRRLIEAQEEERRKLAHELHDEIGQVLTAVILNLEALRSRVAPDAWPKLDESVQVVHQAVEQVRSLSLDLRPSSLGLLGLESALRVYLDRHARRAGLTLEFTSSLAGRRFAPTLETVCFRIVQEAVTNVLRHARASRCWVELRIDGEVQLAVRDNGVGFDVTTARQGALRGEGFGLLSMQERAQLFGGHLEIDSSPDQGTTVRARFPLSKLQEGLHDEGDSHPAGR
jgi:PAS domain S-box-containing protein